MMMFRHCFSFAVSTLCLPFFWSTNSLAMMILTMLIYDDMNVHIRDSFRVWVDIVTFPDPLASIVGQGTCLGWLNPS